jgi:C2 domain-containing protein 3
VASESSRVSFDPPPSDAEDDGKKTVEGLSVERLTLLGRVQAARVMVHDLNLKPAQDDAGGDRTKATTAKGKPPKPAAVKVKAANCTYFVEYNFPVSAASRDKPQTDSATLATEVMRAASKKVSGNAVTFNHRSVFPVSFDGNTIDKWWSCALVFKIYSKSGGQRVPQMLGTVSLPLRSVLVSDKLSVDKAVNVADRSSGSKSTAESNEAQWPAIGELKVGIELTSESKDFAAMLAKTRLAESKNPRIIPVGPARARQQRAAVVAATKKAMADDSAKKRRGRPTVHQMSQTAPVAVSVDEMPLLPPPGPRQPYSMQAAVTGHVINNNLTAPGRLDIDEFAEVSL